jgi:hypothetical protein
MVTRMTVGRMYGLWARGEEPPSPASIFGRSVRFRESKPMSSLVPPR